MRPPISSDPALGRILGDAAAIFSLPVTEAVHWYGKERLVHSLLLRSRREEAWAALVNFLRLPSDPAWADYILGIVEQKKRIEEIDGIGCEPVLISATTEEMLAWIGQGLRSHMLAVPDTNSAIRWPRYPVQSLSSGRRPHSRGHGFNSSEQQGGNVLSRGVDLAWES